MIYKPSDLLWSKMHFEYEQNLKFGVSAAWAAEVKLDSVHDILWEHKGFQPSGLHFCFWTICGALDWVETRLP